MTREEAIKNIKSWDFLDEKEMEAIATLVPELKESDDDRMKKLCISVVKQFAAVCRKEDKYLPEVEKCIAWLEKQGENNMGISEATKQKLEDNLNKALEKETPESWNEFLDEQGEQKPAEYTLEQAANIFLGALSNSPYNNTPITDAQVITRELLNFLSDARSYNPNAINEQKPAWSEEDEEMVEDIIEAIDTQYAVTDYNEMVSWLKSLKDRVQPQPKQEWSEEDEETLKDIITSMTNLKDSATSDALRDIYNSKIAWLKSLRPQSQWKPSDEMLEALYRVIAENVMEKSEDEMLLDKLYQGLKYGKVK